MTTKSPNPEDPAIDVQQMLLPVPASDGFRLLTDELRPLLDDERYAGNALELFLIKGDSMVSEPRHPSDLCPGDWVVVRLGDTRVNDSGLFVVFDGHGLIAKHVSRIATTSRVRITSNDPRVLAQEVDEADARIMGRIVARWQRLH